jgi:hypothetical protein
MRMPHQSKPVSRTAGEIAARGTVQPAGPVAYAACVGLCTLLGGIGFPFCVVACIPLFVAPGP